MQRNFKVAPPTFICISPKGGVVAGLSNKQNGNVTSTVVGAVGAETEERTHTGI